jgi:outer membrane lipoprotein-sorting protein
MREFPLQPSAQLLRSAAALSFVLAVSFSVCADPTPDARQIVSDLEARFDSFSSLSFEVSRTTRTSDQSQADKWVFTYKKPDKLRIDYLEPHKRTIVASATELVEYIPQLEKAMKTDLRATPEADRSKIIARSTAPVAIMGLRLDTIGGANPAELSPTLVGEETIDGSKTYRIELRTEAKQAAGNEATAWIDPLRQVLVRSEARDERGNMLFSTEAGRFREIEEDVWFPGLIEVRKYGSSSTTETCRLRNIQVNTPVPDTVFRVELPENTELTVVEGR